VRKDLGDRLAEALKTLNAPDLAELGQVTPKVASLEQEVESLQKMQDEWAKLRAVVTPMPEDVRTAATLPELGQALKRAQPAKVQGGQPPALNMAALSYAAPQGTPAVANAWDKIVAVVAGAPAEIRAKATAQAWTAYTLRVQLGGLLVKGLVYLFALLVGWAALYLSNLTFGARPEDYIALFLWGATVNVIAGQQVKLENIYGHTVEELKLPSPG
jgi:hypothetical protein